MSGAPNDIFPPGERIISYKLIIIDCPWTEIECKLANGKKLTIGFLTDSQWADYIEENPFSHSHVYAANMWIDNQSVPYVKYSLYFELKYFEKILDLFRNEKPVYFIFTTNTDLISQPTTATILTGIEPTGSGESFEVAIPGVIIYNRDGVRVNIAQLLAEQMQNSGISVGETKKLIAKIASICSIGLKSKDLTKVAERITKDPRYKAEFQQDPEKAVRKIGLGR